MAKKTAPLLPSTEALLRQFGDRLRLARQRRRLSAKQVAERTGMSPMTLRSLERGGSGVTMGAYLAVMQVLGIETDIALLAKVDLMGRELQDARLSAPSKTTPPKRSAVVGEMVGVAHDKQPESAEFDRDWIEKRGFINAETLTQLIDPVAPLSKKRR